MRTRETMIYTVFAIIICVAITGTVGMKPMIGAIGLPRVAGEEPDERDFGYDCDAEPKEHRESMGREVLYCMKTQRWVITDQELSKSLAKTCCFFYDMLIMFRAILDSECQKVVHKENPEMEKVVTNCTAGGYPVSTTYCESRPERQPMGADCNKRIDDLLIAGLTDKPNPTAGPHPPVTHSPGGPSATVPSAGHSSGDPCAAVMVLLAAIVVSIAGDVYAF